MMDKKTNMMPDFRELSLDEIDAASGAGLRGVIKFLRKVFVGDDPKPPIVM
jgi:hypothetical protein